MGKIKGGVSVYVRDKYRVSVIANTQLSLDYIECIGLRLELGDVKIHVLSVYRRPGGDRRLFLEKLEEIISIVRLTNSDELYICGDFNLDLLNNGNSSNARDLLMLGHSLSLLPIISKPTRITDNTATFIDHIYVTIPTGIIFGIIVSDITYHMPTFCIRNNLFNSNNDIPSNVTVQYRVTSEGALGALCDRRNTYDFEDIVNMHDIDAAQARVVCIIETEFNSCRTLRHKNRSIKSQRKPWITASIIANIRKRKAYLSLYLQNKLPRDYYVRFRNFVTNHLRLDEFEYYNGKFNQLKGDSRGTWGVINNVIRPDRTKPNKQIDKLKIGNDVIDTDFDIASALNNHFSSIGGSIANSVPPTDTDPISFLE